MSWPGLVLVTGGGTGGHVFPGLAVAEVLAEMGARVHWLGSRRGIELKLVPQAGIPLALIHVSGLRGKGLLRRLTAPLLLILGIFEAVWLIIRLRPACVLGTGGFVSAPGGVAAWLMRRPLVIHEQNAVAGTTNRLLARLADRILCGFPGCFEQSNSTRFVGNPVRHAMLELSEPAVRLARRTGPLRLLVIGGSQGSRAINRAVAGALSLLADGERPEVWHQCGEIDYAHCRHDYSERGVTVRLDPFIGSMHEAYAWADLVLCRSGALTVAEIAATGSAAIFVPLPSAIDNHQRHNAAWLVNQDAALLIDESELTPARLARELRALSGDRDELTRIAEKARAMALVDAASQVARACREVCGGR